MSVTASVKWRIKLNIQCSVTKQIARIVYNRAILFQDWFLELSFAASVLDNGIRWYKLIVNESWLYCKWNITLALDGLKKNLTFRNWNSRKRLLLLFFSRVKSPH